MKEQKEQAQTQKEKPASNVRTFFTPELNAQIAEMSMKEMESLMKGMISSREFIAILKYVNSRSIMLDSQLRTTNPTADPHSISWAQGAMAGVYDIENYVIDLNAPKAEETEPEENTNYGPEGQI